MKRLVITESEEVICVDTSISDDCGSTITEEKLLNMCM